MVRAQKRLHTPDSVCNGKVQKSSIGSRSARRAVDCAGALDNQTRNAQQARFRAPPMLFRRSALALLPAFALACSSESSPTNPERAAGFVHVPLTAPAPLAPRPARSAGEANVRVVGAMINGPTRAQFGGQAQLAFLGAVSRTRLALEVSLPSGGIIDVDESASELAAFSDDRGTDLAAAEGFTGPFESMAEIAEDGRSAVVIVASEAMPAEGASRLEAKGTLVLTTASVQRTHVAERVELQPGASFVLGPHRFQVVEVGPQEWSEQWSFTVETDSDVNAIVSWTVTDAEGREHEATPWMTMSTGDRTQQSLFCDEINGPATITVRAWDNARRVQVPFSVSSGLGLR
jgi:hypothetical protein